jgi:lipopolysaccharide transport system permease protein
MSSDIVSIIKPKSGWQAIDLKELKEYRDLFYFLVWRDIKVLYAQTILGFSWNAGWTSSILPMSEIYLKIC